jgi:hypothetical protein
MEETRNAFIVVSKPEEKALRGRLCKKGIGEEMAESCVLG